MRVYMIDRIQGGHSSNKRAATGYNLSGFNQPYMTSSSIELGTTGDDKDRGQLDELSLEVSDNHSDCPADNHKIYQSNH